MTSNRRTFLKCIPASLVVGAEHIHATGQEREIECLDYGLSFICNKASFNEVRFWVESRNTLIDAEAGTSQVYYQLRLLQK